MDVLISGASIAGPALAFGLARHGHTVTVVEQAPALRDGGHAVDVRGAALDVIERMGLRDALRPFETDTETNALVDARGRTFGRTARGFGVIDANDVEILRGDLVRVLYDATRARVAYRFGETIEALEGEPGGVSVRFASGTRASFDAVIGADGVHSRVRALAFGPEEAYVDPLGCCMAVFTVPNVLGLDREQLTFHGRGCIATVKSADRNRALKVCLFVAAPEAGLDARDVAAQRSLVARAFSEAGWEMKRIVDAMGDAADFYCDVTCQVRMPQLTAGRVALVGDAAFCPSPMAGQGTSMALVGAHVLAHELGGVAGDPAAAFARYDAAMRPFVVRNQAIARKLAAGFLPRTRFQVWSRNAVLGLLPYVGSGVMKMAMREIRDASRAVALASDAAEGQPSSCVS